MTMTLTQLQEKILRLHNQIRDAVVAATETAALDTVAAVAAEEAGDTIYAIDRVSEEKLVTFFTAEVAPHVPILLIAEGLPPAGLVLPTGTAADAVQWRIIVDPIDGTRGLMYQKRSGWILTGVAPNRGPQTSLQDIQLAVQTEIPLVKQHLSDQLSVIRGLLVHATRYNRLTGESVPLQLKPSTSSTIAHGFAMIARYFPGMRDELAAIDEEIVLGALGPVQRGKAHCFEDQYISSGGQLYELMAGHDRFVADIRPLLEPLLHQRGLALGICCHPYDVCTALIAQTLGVIITDAQGSPLNPPLDITSEVSWAGYANEAIRDQIAPHLHHALRRRGLFPDIPAPAIE